VISEPTILGVVVGLVVGVIYVAIVLRKGLAPTFGSFAVILLSCVGVVVSAQFGYQALKMPREQLGPFQDQRLPMVLGAAAIIWISVETVAKIISPLLRASVAAEETTASSGRQTGREET
jgi:uncharacterized membrane protein YeaQ/YmgE (transglycosylase-associated protein family)